MAAPGPLDKIKEQIVPPPKEKKFRYWLWQKTDNVVFGGAEQRTIEKQYQADVQKFIKDYRGPMECVANYPFNGANCEKCGRALGRNYGELPGGFYLCETCAETKMENPDQEAPWSWKRKPPVKI